MKLQFKHFKKFLKENRWTLTRIGLSVAAVVIMPDSVSYAQTGTTDYTISVLTQPLARMESLMSGPVPKAIVTISAATFVSQTIGMLIP